MYKVEIVENGWIVSEFHDSPGKIARKWVFTDLDKMVQFFNNDERHPPEF